MLRHRPTCNVPDHSLATNGANLPDKVYLFQSPQDSLMLENIALELFYVYYLRVEIVTPYNCSVAITLWDPNGNHFNIFESELDMKIEGANYYEIPFGTALAGNYDVLMNVTTDSNVNIYIKMEQGPQCMYDKIPMEEISGIKLYKITRFSNRDSITPSISFKTDYMYKFCVGRVSPISTMESSEVRIDLTIENPEGIIYTILSNTTLAGFDDIEQFKFGTAVKGTYSFSITIYCNVENVNIGYSVIELYQISSGIPLNQTELPSNTTINQYFTMPTEWTIGILGFAGTITAIIGVVLYKQKKKSVMSSSF